MFRKSAFVAALALLPALAVAQPREGDWTFTMGGSGFATRNVDAGQFGVAFEIGNFVTRELEVSLRQFTQYVNLNGTAVNATTAVAGDWHFDFDQWQPFVGANIGFAYGRGVRDTGFAAPEAGLKYYVNSRTFIYGLAEYQFRFRSSNGRATREFWVFTTGIGFNW